MRVRPQLQSPERLVKSQQLNLLSWMAARYTSHTHYFDAIKGFLAGGDIVVDKLMWQFQLVQHSKITRLIRYCLETCCHSGTLLANTRLVDEAVSRVCDVRSDGFGEKQALGCPAKIDSC
jgi:hypothetical protein